ncbi:MAG: EF-P lysine aminoacylase EpmA [Sandaracinaceae bacterium]
MRLRGRVVLAEGARWLLRVADARGVTFELEVADAARAAPGDLVVVEGREVGPTRLGDVRLVERTTPEATFPRPDGDWIHTQRTLPGLRARAEVLSAIRAHLDGEGFLEVETPSAVPSPGLDLHLRGFEVSGMGAPRFLITSPEYQMKRLLVGGAGPIYQLARCFRRDEQGALHEPEFTMLEWYRPFAGAEEVMRDTEALVAAAATRVRGEPTLERDGRTIDVAPPWPRVRVEDALQQHAGCGLADVESETAFFERWAFEVEPRLGVDRPCFVTHWPASMASLARLHPEDPRFADRFEAYVAGIELCNGFGELTDPREQRARLERDVRARREQGLDAYPIDERFLVALEEGMPPSGGNALGVDRLVMLAAGAASLADVIAFGHDRI